jgi:anti-sigma-K factor RskA
VLGLAGSGAEARLTADPGFAAAVAAWAARFEPLLDEIPPATPSPALWDRVGPWRIATAASLAAAAASLWVAILRPAPRPPLPVPAPPIQSAILATPDGRALFVATLEPPGRSPTGAPTGPVVATGALTTL